MRETAILAAGCFWGVQELFRNLDGVLETEVGYCGGETEAPTYQDVKMGNTGHAEALRVVFDPEVIRYPDILSHFFRLHDPTTKNRQGNDVGSQYRSALFYQSERQKQQAEQMIQRLNEAKTFGQEVVTEISPDKPFYSAEDYHQDYLQKNPGGYTCHFIRELDLPDA